MKIDVAKKGVFRVKITKPSKPSKAREATGVIKQYNFNDENEASKPFDDGRIESMASIELRFLVVPLVPWTSG